MTAYAVVWCDHPGCSQWIDPGAETVAAARRLARLEGWLNGGPADWCPLHGEEP